jgi:hypothetical protein
MLYVKLDVGHITHVTNDECNLHTFSVNIMIDP